MEEVILVVLSVSQFALVSSLPLIETQMGFSLTFIGSELSALGLGMEFFWLFFCRDRCLELAFGSALEFGCCFLGCKRSSRSAFSIGKGVWSLVLGMGKESCRRFVSY